MLLPLTSPTSVGEVVPACPHPLSPGLPITRKDRTHWSTEMTCSCFSTLDLLSQVMEKRSWRAERMLEPVPAEEERGQPVHPSLQPQSPHHQAISHRHLPRHERRTGQHIRQIWTHIPALPHNSFVLIILGCSHALLPCVPVSTYTQRE